MTRTVSWRDWLTPYAGEPGHPFMARAIAALVANDRFPAVWISGSRATRVADAHSDLDIRVHSPSWTAGDISSWLGEVDAGQRALVRLSKLSPSHWNYECVFARTVVIDLIVFTGLPLFVSADSVVFKASVPLEVQTSLAVVKEIPVCVEDVRNLMDGMVIDQNKFLKLFARDERLNAFFLLDAQRLAMLRLAYIATRGVDCGPRVQHTLASLKFVRRTILDTADLTLVGAVNALSEERTIEENVEKLEIARAAIFSALRRRFPSLPAD